VSFLSSCAIFNPDERMVSIEECQNVAYSAQEMMDNYHQKEIEAYKAAIIDMRSRAEYDKWVQFLEIIRKYGDRIEVAFMRQTEDRLDFEVKFYERD
jgi:hypothetical protein